MVSNSSKDPDATTQKVLAIISSVSVGGEQFPLPDDNSFLICEYLKKHNPGIEVQYYYYSTVEAILNDAHKQPTFRNDVETATVVMFDKLHTKIMDWCDSRTLSGRSLD